MTDSPLHPYNSLHLEAPISSFSGMPHFHMNLHAVSPLEIVLSTLPIRQKPCSEIHSPHGLWSHSQDSDSRDTVILWKTIFYHHYTQVTTSADRVSHKATQLMSLSPETDFRALRMTSLCETQNGLDHPKLPNHSWRECESKSRAVTWRWLCICNQSQPEWHSKPRLFYHTNLQRVSASAEQISVHVHLVWSSLTSSWDLREHSPRYPFNKYSIKPSNSMASYWNLASKCSLTPAHEPARSQWLITLVPQELLWEASCLLAFPRALLIKAILNSNNCLIVLWQCPWSHK